MDTFSQWADIPKHLATKTTLEKAGLKLAPGQTPVARKTGGYGPYDLYDKRDAVPKRAMTGAQTAAALRNLEMARAALRCCDCHVYGERLDKNGRCYRCRDRYDIAEQSDYATRRLEELANASDWIIVDTETTGLGNDAEIVQIGIVDADGNKLMDRLVRPLGPIEPEATAIHGITADMVAGEPAWADIWPEVSGLINGRLVLTYNAAFDGRMVKQSCAAHDLSLPDTTGWECVMELFAAHTGDYSDYHGGFRWYTLERAALYHRGIRLSESERRKLHDASGDAWLTWRLVKSFGNIDGQ